MKFQIIFSDIIETRVNNLGKYQDNDYADKYMKLINKVGK